MNNLIPNNNNFDPTSLIQSPNDHVEMYMSPKGARVVANIKTEKLNATYQRYMKKDGTPGKPVIILKQI